MPQTQIDWSWSDKGEKERIKGAHLSYVLCNDDVNLPLLYSKTSFKNGEKPKTLTAAERYKREIKGKKRLVPAEKSVPHLFKTFKKFEVFNLEIDWHLFKNAGFEFNYDADNTEIFLHVLLLNF